MADTAFCEEALSTHNMYRERHGAPALKLSARLCRSAQEWAEGLLTMPVLQNSPLANGGEVGENISMRRGSDVVDIGGEEVTSQWYNDVSKYDFQRGLGEAGNFTQLVWISTTEVGYGKARSRDGSKCIVVAHYSPPGNVIGNYVQNVRPLVVQAEKEGEKNKIRVDIGLKNDRGAFPFLFMLKRVCLVPLFANANAVLTFLSLQSQLWSFATSIVILWHVLMPACIKSAQHCSLLRRRACMSIHSPC